MNNKHWTDDTQQRQPRKNDIGTDGIRSTASRSQLASAQTNSNYVKIRGESDCECVEQDEHVVAADGEQMEC